MDTELLSPGAGPSRRVHVLQVLSLGDGLLLLGAGLRIFQMLGDYAACT